MSLMMRRLASTVLVAWTAVAALLASSLQGKVVCYADGGHHFAVEAPHKNTDAHCNHDTHSDPASSHEPEHGGCTDVSAEFPATREVRSRLIQAQQAELTALPPLPVATFLLAAGAPSHPSEANDRPPPPELLCVRTIVLLV